MVSSLKVASMEHPMCWRENYSTFLWKGLMLMPTLHLLRDLVNWRQEQFVTKLQVRFWRGMSWILMASFLWEWFFCFPGIPQDLLELSIKHRDALSEVLDISTEESSEGELAAMVSFAIAFPDGFMALVDTYDVKRYFAFRQNSLGFVCVCVEYFWWKCVCFFLIFFPARNL